MMAQFSSEGVGYQRDTPLAKFVYPAIGPLIAVAFSFGVLDNKVEQNAQDISELNGYVKEARAMASEMRETLAVIQSRQKEQIELVAKMTRTFETVRNSQAQYTGKITSKLTEASQYLNIVSRRLEEMSKND